MLWHSINQANSWLSKQRTTVLFWRVSCPRRRHYMVYNSNHKYDKIKTLAESYKYHMTRHVTAQVERSIRYLSVYKFTRQWSITGIFASFLIDLMGKAVRIKHWWNFRRCSSEKGVVSCTASYSDRYSSWKQLLSWHGVLSNHMAPISWTFYRENTSLNRNIRCHSASQFFLLLLLLSWPKWRISQSYNSAASKIV